MNQQGAAANVSYDDEPPVDQYGDHYPDVVTPIRSATHANLDAERAVLGALLVAPQTAEALYDAIDGDDFYEPRHQAIWDAAHTARLRDGVPPDVITITAEFRDHGQVAKLSPLLPDLATACPNPSLALKYAADVRNTARQRRVALALGVAQQRIATSSPELLELHLGDVLQDITDQATRFAATHSRSNVNYVAFNGIFAKPRTPTQWVIAPLLAAGRITLLYAPGKTGKSLVAMESAAAIATGRPAFATDTPTGPQHVLYIDQEMTEDDWIDRLAEMGYGAADEPNLNTYLHLAQLQAWPPMDTPAGGAAVETAARQTGATTVIIDTASKVIAGEENSNDTQQAFYRHTLIPLKRAGIAVMVLDHTGKDLERGARGGSAKTDNIDLAFELLKRGRDVLTLRCSHARVRDELLDEPLQLRRTTSPLAHRIEHLGLSDEAAGSTRPTFLMDRVSRYVEANPRQSKNAIETAVKGKAEYVRLALELLVAEQYVEVTKGPRNTSTHMSIRPFREEGQTDA